ncbi:hypothetical protein ADICYQ_4454 [Cyclobacterium qasimii M12-11B]|uniref:Uncharacterized protein n=1 Tax=Cyclobacterium qasimii M12-11B TaxID=641524 RepID=S7VAE7_9BACT|nr:hypothetical protein ADICYQ_4454 [Cyclobacterium qasimii M12-11B]
MDPEIKVNQMLFGEEIIGSSVMKYAMTTPAGNIKMATMFQRLMSRKIMIALISINPQKNDHKGIGYFSMKNVMAFEKAKILVRIPRNKVSKKLAFTCFQKATMSSLVRSFRAVRSNELILSRSSS